MTGDPAAAFEPHRRRLLGLAYRMLGSMAEAEDAVQEAYLRWHDADRANVADPRAFLITTTTRICLDVLKSARVRREAYVGPWLPDPVTDGAALAPDAQTELAEDLSPVAARARGIPAARRLRLFVHADRRHAEPERGGVPAAGEPRPVSRARNAACWRRPGTARIGPGGREARRARHRLHRCRSIG
jgi:hypothetical protein